MNRTKEGSDKKKVLPLQVALKLLKKEKPWVPIHALRAAVGQGKVKAIRSSEARNARYYVTLDDLEAALPIVQGE